MPRRASRKCSLSPRRMDVGLPGFEVLSCVTGELSDRIKEALGPAGGVAGLPGKGGYEVGKRLAGLRELDLPCAKSLDYNGRSSFMAYQIAAAGMRTAA